MEFVDLHSGKSKFVPRTLPEKVWNNLLRKRYKKFNNTFENRILKSYRVKLGHAIKLCDQVKRERERERERRWKISAQTLSCSKTSGTLKWCRSKTAFYNPFLAFLLTTTADFFFQLLLLWTNHFCLFYHFLNNI